MLEDYRYARCARELANGLEKISGEIAKRLLLLKEQR
jgi:hypothetical protein